MSAVECTIGGSKLIKEQIAELVFETAANQPASLTLWLEGGFYEKPEWPTGSDREALGSDVTCKITPQDSTTPVKLFTGILVARHIVIENQRLRMQLFCQCSAMKAGEGVLTRAVKKKVKDHILIQDILKAAGVKLSGKQATCALENAQRILPEMTPWDYARHVAADNGLILLALRDGLSVVDPKKPSKVHAIKLGTRGVIGMDLRFDASPLEADITINAWDIKEQKITASKTAEAPSDLKKIATTLKRTGLKLQRSDPISKGACEVLAQARMLRAELASKQGRIVFSGYADILPGERIQLDKVPKDYQTKLFVSAQKYSLKSTEEPQTEIVFGLPVDRFAAAKPMPECVLMSGTVQTYKDDPEKLQRIPVKLHGLVAPDNVAHVRLLTPLAGNQRGLYLPPQPNDEVVIGFLGGSYDYPVLIGSVHNPKQPPPFPYADKAPQHALVLTKDQLQWLFDAKQKTLTLCANDKHLLTLADKEGLLFKQDKSTLTFNKDITLHSGQKLQLKDDKSTLTFDGSGNVDIQPATSVNIK